MIVFLAQRYFVLGGHALKIPEINDQMISKILFIHTVAQSVGIATGFCADDKQQTVEIVQTKHATNKNTLKFIVRTLNKSLFLLEISNLAS